MIDERDAMSRRQLRDLVVTISVERCEVHADAPPCPSLAPAIGPASVELVRHFFIGGKRRKNRQLGSVVHGRQLEDERAEHAVQALVVAMAREEAPLLVQQELVEARLDLVVGVGAEITRDGGQSTLERLLRIRYSQMLGKDLPPV